MSVGFAASPVLVFNLDFLSKRGLTRSFEIDVPSACLAHGGRQPGSTTFYHACYSLRQRRYRMNTALSLAFWQDGLQSSRYKDIRIAQRNFSVDSLSWERHPSYHPAPESPTAVADSRAVDTTHRHINRLLPPCRLLFLHECVWPTAPLICSTSVIKTDMTISYVYQTSLQRPCHRIGTLAAYYVEAFFSLSLYKRIEAVLTSDGRSDGIEHAGGWGKGAITEGLPALKLT